MFEFHAAYTARRLAPKADPALNPSQPNQSRNVPRQMRETLCGLLEEGKVEANEAENEIMNI